MKKNALIILLLLTAAIVNAQRKTIDSLRVSLTKATVDTDRLKIMNQLSYSYFVSNPDSAIIFAQQAYELALKYNKKNAMARSLNLMANAYTTPGDYAKALQNYFKAIRVYENLKDEAGVIAEYNNIGSLYVEKADYQNALRYLQIAGKRWKLYTASHKLKTLADRELQAIIDLNVGECYLYTNKIDSASFYLQRCYTEANNENFLDIIENIDRDLGEVEIESGHKEAALKYLRKAISLSITADDVEMLSVSYLSTAKLYHKYKQQDSAEYYAKKALEVAKSANYLQDVLNAGKRLYTYYDEDKNLPEAYKYFKLTTAAKDSLYSQEQVKQLLTVDFEEKQRQQDIDAAQNQYNENTRTYALIAGLLVLLLLVFIFWRNGRQRQNTNLALQRKNADIEAALTKLQLTQNQLIQSEKMASLGELTAGIAHEIQNPLNFVNNFSEVNIELINEMETELESGTKEEVIAILEDVKQNLEKIGHHGKRADAIVKGMLQHSRASSNVKEPTDINKLADEYFRLAYHGLRAKDKSFNSELITKFSENLPLLNVVPQDIGRVLLNLFTNAFYAVHQKQKARGAAYQPIVTVSTCKEDSFVVIKVKDNGGGIPPNIKDKIMQPFFTTKPTGEGTGLGLSLSYEITVKGHGGHIEVDSEEGEYTEFIIKLPI